MLTVQQYTGQYVHKLSNNSEDNMLTVLQYTRQYVQIKSKKSAGDNMKTAGTDLPS
jgi:hypothetical protein